MEKVHAGEPFLKFGSPRSPSFDDDDFGRGQSHGEKSMPESLFCWNVKVHAGEPFLKFGPPRSPPILMMWSPQFLDLAKKSCKKNLVPPFLTPGGAHAL